MAYGMAGFRKALWKSLGVTAVIVQYGCIAHCTLEFVGGFVVVSLNQSLNTLLCLINAPSREAENKPLSLSISMKLTTCTLSAENLIEIGSVVPEIWPSKFKSPGHVYSGRHVYSEKYGRWYEW